MAVKRHYDHSNSYKEKHLIGVAYNFRGLVYSYHGGTWWPAGKHGAGERCESSKSWSIGNSKWTGSLGIAWAQKTLKPTLTVTQFLQQGHTYSNQATPPNSANPYEFMGPIKSELQHYPSHSVILENTGLSKGCLCFFHLVMNMWNIWWAGQIQCYRTYKCDS